MANRNIVQEIMELENFQTLTPIQKQVVERKNKNRDLIGISSTGSGKSHAFFMAVFEQIDASVDEVQAVISTPTRELAFQLYERCKKLANHFGVRIRLVTGGMDRKMSEKQPQIVIGTPGRMKDMFVKENTLRLDTARMVIVDEADMTLEFGFLEDMDEILSKMDKKVQIMVFSATIPEALQPFLKKYLYDPFMISIADSENFQSNVRHILVPCKHRTFSEKLAEVLQHINPYVCLIFANTNQEAAGIANDLRQQGYDLVELHGDLESRERMQAIRTIQSQKKSYIVASDIASRGIDLEGITHVISCGFPKDLKFYIHRSGRTGRAHRDGVCLALYHENDEAAIRDLMRQGISFEHEDIRHGEWVQLKPFGVRRRRTRDPLQKEIEKIVAKKPKKVKPNYKKKQKQEIEKLKRKRKREIIQKDIQRQKKERAKEKQRQKRNAS